MAARLRWLVIAGAVVLGVGIPGLGVFLYRRRQHRIARQLEEIARS